MWADPTGSAYYTVAMSSTYIVFGWNTDLLDPGPINEII